MQKMYPAIVNSPKTELVAAITETDTEIEVADVSVLLEPEGLAVIGNGEGAETIKYTSVDGNILKGCIRGFQGTVKPWGAGTRLARNFTGYDHDTFIRNIEQHDTAITSLTDRLDTADTDDVVLQPGLQVINAAKDARFRLGEIRGRTLINLLGNVGGCETVSDWAPSSSTLSSLSIDTGVKNSGTSSLKYTQTANGNAYARTVTQKRVDPSKYLIIIAWVKNDTSKALSSRFVTNSGGSVPSSKTKALPANSTGLVFQAYTPTELGNNTEFRVDVYSSSAFNAGDTFNFDSVRAYQITQAEYDELNSLTDEQIEEKYPYVPTGIIGVENPYAIRYGENLLPPFYEWSVHANSIISDPYTLTHTPAGAANEYDEVWIPALPSTNFTLTNGFGLQIIGWDSAKSTTTDSWYPTSNSTETYTTSAATSYFRIRINVNNTVGVITINNPMLAIGTELQSFQPQRKSMLAFQTELHANPDTGADPDMLFEQNGEYKKLAKWRKTTLDKASEWLIAQSPAGFKVITTPIPAAKPLVQFITKYNGSQIASTTPGNWTGGDQALIGDNAYLYISISNTDSGWGDDYIPTLDEIEAYTRGWKMYPYGDATGPVAPYTPDKVKGWCYRIDGKTGATNADFTGGTATLPTTQAPNWSPYNLLYRLAKETVEPVVTEGSLLLSEGDNMVEVGTGIVLRERANPQYYSGTSVWIINDGSANYTQTRLKRQVDTIVDVYQDSLKITWARDATNAYGKERAIIPGTVYDQSSPYTVTYIKLDKSPIQPIAGVLAANEKAQISDLTAGVAEALQRVSVVEQKKADEDAPGWITPTLLNGAVQGSTPVRYKKMPDGTVRFIGIFVPTAPSTVFKLLVGHRPKDILRIPIVSFRLDGTVFPSYAYIEKNGEVAIGLVGDNYTSFDGVSFMAEQ